MGQGAAQSGLQSEAQSDAQTHIILEIQKRNYVTSFESLVQISVNFQYSTVGPGVLVIITSNCKSYNPNNFWKIPTESI